MSGYSRQGLKDGIVSCKKNIRIFEEAIKKERNTIVEYRFMIDEIDKKEAAAEAASITIDADDVREDDKPH